MLNYAEKIFALRESWSKTHDSRPAPRFLPPVFPAAWFLMFAARLPSFNAFEQLRDSKCLQRWVGASKLPCSDEMAIVSESTDPATLRDSLGHILERLRRNKVLEPRHGFMLAAIDGHETHSSYKRCCPGCLERKLTVGGCEVVQYYHRYTVLQLIGKKFYFLLDLEPVLPGEDEVASAMRLLTRVVKNHPRCCDVITCDAIYLRPSMINLTLSLGKHLIAVLKDNQPELLTEARTLLPEEPPECFERPKTPGKSVRQVELRQADGFTTETIRTPLRIVHSHESGTRHERIAGKDVFSPLDSHWYWATTMPATLTGARTVFDFGHDRWRIENEGFNELVTSWHSRHVFHHHSNSMLVLWLSLFAAHAVFYCFLRNLQPALRAARTVIHFAVLITADLYQARWWPPHPR